MTRRRAENRLRPFDLPRRALRHLYVTGSWFLPGLPQEIGLNLVKILSTAFDELFKRWKGPKPRTLGVYTKLEPCKRGERYRHGKENVQVQSTTFFPSKFRPIFHN